MQAVDAHRDRCRSTIRTRVPEHVSFAPTACSSCLHTAQASSLWWLADGDEYTAAGKAVFHLNVVITCQISGSDKVQSVKAPIDRAIVFKDQAGGGSGVDVFVAQPLKGGGDHQDKVALGDKLATLSA